VELLFPAVIALITAFAFMNGFHDASLTVGNSVVTRALTPRTALLLAAVFNFVGALLGQSIAEVVLGDALQFPSAHLSILLVIFAGVLGGLIWNVLTYLVALPVSSTHCLFGGLIGAGLVLGTTAHPAVLFSTVLAPLIVTPLLAFLLSFVLTGFATRVFRSAAPKPLFRGSRIASSVLTGALSLAHGIQDAQKSAAVMMVAWLAYSTAGPIDYTEVEISWPVRLTVASALALGTLLSGWRIARTVSVRMVQLDPVRASVADLTSSSFMYFAAFVFKVPVSMSFLVVGANLGTQFETGRGTARLRYVLPVAGSWLLTLPSAAVLGALLAAPLLLLT
jgi:inorganic phosphate transporter, PiT family